MNSASETFPLRVAAQAAGMQPRALRQWFTLGVMSLKGNDRKSTGPGDHCGLSRRRIYQSAITRSLNNLGVAVTPAARAALIFTDEAQTGRLPGELFPYGKTMLVISADGASTRNCFHDTALSDLSHGMSNIIIDLNRIVEQVDYSLKEELH